MTTKRQSIGLLAGIAAALVIYALPLDGLSRQGQTCLALTIMTVLFWAFQVAQPGYISGLLLVLFVILQVAGPEVVFYSWTGTTMYLIIGAYLIAAAVKNSGLGNRIAYWFILRFMHSYRSVILSVFLITLVLSLLIPHPWPRAFLIMSIMSEVIENAKMPHRDAVFIGYSVFAASVPISCIFLTGDSTINPLALQYAGVELGWFGWFKLMAPPCALAAVLTCIAFLLLFRPSRPVLINKDAVREKLKDMGRLTSNEVRTILWLAIAVVLWMTDSLHNIDIGWITLAVAMLMSLPVVGGLLQAQSWSEVPTHVLLFVTAAMAIGKVGAVTGMNAWIASTLLPRSIPANPFIFAGFVVAVSIVIHMLLGSVIAVMGVAVPTILSYTAGLSIDPLVPTLWVFTAIVMHYVFPFQNMNILVGMGERNGMYTQRETLRFSLPLLAITLLTTIGFQTIWWKLLGLL